MAVRKAVRTQGAKPVADATVNHAYDNVGITLGFYAEVFGRDSLDGQGMAVDSVVHYGQAFANARWTGKQMLFGDCDGEHILGFSQSLDIVAHELTHAVTQHSIHSGLGEVHAGKSVSLLGEGILGPHLGRAVRSLKDPGNTRLTYPDDDQAKDMSGFVPGGDAHVKSGMPNHAFYLAATAVGGHCWERVGKAWNVALPTLAPDASFASAASATVAAGERLFGTGSTEAKAIRSAWQQVKVLR